MRVFVEAVWVIAFVIFLIFTFYRHFFIRPFNPHDLFDRKSESRKLDRTVMAVFFVILISGLLLFAEMP